MRYEIRKEIGSIHCYVAEADTWEWAEKIKDALEAWEGERYHIYVGDILVNNIREAMELSMGIRMEPAQNSKRKGEKGNEAHEINQGSNCSVCGFFSGAYWR